APFEAATWASTFGPESSLPGRGWASRAPVCIPDVVQDPGLLRAPLAARAGLHAACGFPIVPGDVLGIIEGFSPAVRHPDPDLVTLGSQIGQCIERQRAEEALRLARAALAHATRIWCTIQRAKEGSMAASPALWSAVDVESFLYEYYDAWGGTDEDRIMSYYAEDVVLQIPGMLMEGKAAVREQFARPFITAFPGNRHLVQNMIFGPGVVTVEFSFEAQHKGPFAGHAATGARITLPGCGVYEYDA